MSESEVAQHPAVLDFTGIHRVIRGYFTKLDDALAARRTDAAWGKTMAGLLQFAADGLRFHHHVEDDEYWPALVAKGADESALAPLSASHRELDSLLDQLDAAARKLAAAPTDDAVLDEAAALAPPLRQHVLAHLDEEEPIFFPMIERYITVPEAHKMAARVAKSAPKRGVSWIIGGATYAMTPAESQAFLSAFPKPVLLMRPLLLRTYRRHCASLGVPYTF